MKLCSYRAEGLYRAGLVVGEEIIDLGKASVLLRQKPLPWALRSILIYSPDTLLQIAEIGEQVETGLLDASRRMLSQAEIGPPIPNPEKIICVGQNYLDHCREQNIEPPKSPILFAKFPTSLIGPHAHIRIPEPEVASQVDYEVELGVVIGRDGKEISRKDAMDYVVGYIVMNDITARDAQKADGQWVRAKSFDTFAPSGPYLVTKDEIPDPANLHIWLKLNDKIMQDSSTSNLIFDIPFLIEYISRTVTLKAGDIISTGTPPGVGIHRRPPVLLQSGDIVEAGIDGIGVLRNVCKKSRLKAAAV